MEDVLQCDTCKKDGSFYEDDLPQLYSMLDLENGIYCNDCIPEAWERILEGWVKLIL